MVNGFQLLLFSTNSELIPRAVDAGVAGIIVDWENIGKRTRQKNADTEINFNGLHDLQRVRRCTDALVICRINHLASWTRDEVEKAIGAGADEILLPMVRSAQQVEQLLEMVNGRCEVGVLIETIDAVRHVFQIRQLPLRRMYIGLNDLAIERGSANIFSALPDGTVEQVCKKSVTCKGFGGLTVPNRGFPIPCRLLIYEMARLQCQFSFLRRSFHRDIKDIPVEKAVPQILTAVQNAQKLPLDDLLLKKQELDQLIRRGISVSPELTK
ncbi:MAG: aldolase/citrate lyase family protein [Ardenticatenaceae bacterium]|nr:aldolase/citrate lyase family protein [Ardenticatenaceae bacterium]